MKEALIRISLWLFVWDCDFGRGGPRLGWQPASHQAFNYHQLQTTSESWLPALASPRNSWSQSSQLQIEIAIQIKIVSPVPSPQHCTSLSSLVLTTSVCTTHSPELSESSWAKIIIFKCSRIFQQLVSLVLSNFPPAQCSRKITRNEKMIDWEMIKAIIWEPKSLPKCKGFINM